MYGLSLEKYFGEGKIELLLRKIESLTEIKLKTTSR